MFKKYDQNQQIMFFQSLQDFVPEGHIARIINDIIDEIDITAIESTYSKNGCHAYHPRLLLKMLLYGYMINIRSSRDLENITHTDTVFMYLTAMQHPNFRTICNFRIAHYDAIADIFKQTVELCREMGMLSAGKMVLDGTKIKANASVKQSKTEEDLDKEIDRILKECAGIDAAEDEKYGNSTPWIGPKKLASKTEKLRIIRSAKDKIKQEGLKKINVTDNDAKIMKHKDASKKPSYNGQVIVDTKEQVIVAANLVTEENDVHQVSPMIKLIWETLGCKPTILLADAGYFSYDNLELLDGEAIDAYIPDNFYRVDEFGNTKKFRKYLFRYDEKKDCYYCPAAIMMPFSRIQTRKNRPDVKLYTCMDCSNCALKTECTKANNRTISRDPREHLLVNMREKINTEIGQIYKIDRLITVESVFGQMKENRGFRQFLLRGRGKANIEFLMMCIVHNIKKIGTHVERTGDCLKNALNKVFPAHNLKNSAIYLVNMCKRLNYCRNIGNHLILMCKI